MSASRPALSSNLMANPLNPGWIWPTKVLPGFAWGYLGSGPAQLALAILADYLRDDNTALAHYQAFKEKVIGKLPQG